MALQTASDIRPDVKVHDSAEGLHASAAPITRPSTFASLSLSSIKSFFKVSVAAAILNTLSPDPAKADTLQNAVITPPAVEMNGSIAAHRLPDGTRAGEPGIVVSRIPATETPNKIVSILSGRPSTTTGVVRWDVFLENFEINLYTVSNYTNGLAASHTIQLGRPVDQSGNMIGTVNSGSSVIPNTPLFADLTSSTNPLSRRGYWFGFKVTTNPDEANQTTAYISQAQLDFMRNNDFVMSLMAVTDFGSIGGVRMGAQEPGFGQVGLNPSTFNSSGQAPGIVADGSTVSYALQLNSEQSPNAPINTPEPGTAALFGAGALVLYLVRENAKTPNIK